MTDGSDSGRVGHAVGLLRAEGSATQASFVELFFDLFVVFTLTRLVAYAVANLSPDAQPPERWITLARELLMLLTLLWAWTITTYVTAWFDPKRPAVQIFVVSTAFGMLIMGASIPQAFDGRAAGFAYPYVIMQLVRTLALGLMLRGHSLRRPFLHATAWYCLSTVPWLIGVAAGSTARILLWSAALLIDLGSARAGWPLPGTKRYRINPWAAHPRYLATRFQQLLMISLGEPLLAVGIIFSQRPASTYRVIALLTAFLTTVLLWRIYFHVAGELLPDALLSAADRTRVGRIAGVAHITMICGIVSNGVGHEIIQSYPDRHTDPAWLVMIIGGPAARRPGGPAARRPGGPAARRPGGPAARRPGGPAARRPGGPAVYVAGRAVLERVVFSRISRRRIVAIAVLLLLVAPSLLIPPTGAAVATSLVLLGVAVADTRQSWKRPVESPLPLR